VLLKGEKLFPSRISAFGLHRSLRVTPAMAAGVTNRVWSLEELVERTSK
jgi:hypothetical protein